MTAVVRLTRFAPCFRILDNGNHNPRDGPKANYAMAAVSPAKKKPGMKERMMAMGKTKEASTDQPPNMRQTSDV